MKKSVLKSIIASSLAFCVVSVGVCAAPGKPVEGVVYHLKRVDDLGSQPGLCGALLDAFSAVDITFVKKNGHDSFSSSSHNFTFGQVVKDQSARSVPFTYQSDDGITVKAKLSWKVSNSDTKEGTLGSCKTAVKLVSDAS